MVVLMAGLLAAGCGDEDDPEPASSMDFESDEPMLIVEPVPVDFPADVAPGDEEEKFITLTNMGAEILELSDIRISELTTNIYFFPGENFPSGELSLEGLESYEFSIIYRPQDMERHRSAINMESNDPDWVSPTIMLRSDAYPE